MKALVTTGPTYEPIDPVRFIGNRSSGKQGVEVAKALANKGIEVTLVAGVVDKELLKNLPFNITVKNITTAEEMFKECEQVIPCDIAILVAAVSDWQVKIFSQDKLKKGEEAPVLQLKETPDILKTICGSPSRPKVVIGFAAETKDILENAKKKLAKGCDAIVANSVEGGNVFGKDENEVSIITQDNIQKLPKMSKKDIAEKIADFAVNGFKVFP